MKKKPLSESYNEKDISVRFRDLPKRIFLDSNVLQYANDFGELIFDHTNKSKNYLLSNAGKKIFKSNRLFDEILALEQIFLGINRANFEFAVSKNVFKEVIKKKDDSYTNWFFEMWNHWQSVMRDYNNKPFSDQAQKNYEKAQADTSLK